MITLPLRSERIPLVRVLIADRFNNVNGVGGAGPWNLLPMLSDVHAGFELLDGLTRPALPEIGECQLRMRFGVINGKIIGLSPSSFASGAWDPTTDLLEVPSLVGKEIRVQLAADVGDGETPGWRTEWWGSCEYESDSEWPGASIPVGERICHCLDGFYRTKRWFMTQHAAYISSTQYPSVASPTGAVGHPGYNIGLNGKTLGNRESSGVVWTPFPDSDNKLYAHAWQGTGNATVWTDQQAAEHALRVSRPEGQPQFNFSGSTTLLSTGASPWKVEESDSAHDVTIRICARERARGLVYVDWADDSADPTGPLAVRLSVKAQTADDLTYITDPTTGTTGTIQGATNQGTTVAVDLIGDHRAQPQGFNRSLRGITKYDAVETVGEQIQVLITGSRTDGASLSLEDRWSSSDATAFAALAFDARVDERWRQVYQSYGIPRAWQGRASDHDAGAEYASHRVDYRCDDEGAVVVPTGDPDTSPLLVKILPDTPLLEGYIYSGLTPARRDAGTETGEPDRRPPTPWIRNAANKYELGAELAVNVKNDALHVTFSSDEKSGARYISALTTALGGSLTTSQLGVTFALELPHRLRFKTISEDLPSGLGVRNIKRIEVPDAHLWLASPGAIWGYDDTTGTADGYTARRGACGGTLTNPGVLRDDRARVAVLHALACAWYLQEHRPASWTLRCCGLLPNFGVSTAVAVDASAEIDPTSVVAYPTLGQLVTTLAANGQTITVNAPITGIIYNHQSQTTTWSCDWIDYDVRRA